MFVREIFSPDAKKGWIKGLGQRRKAILQFKFFPEIADKKYMAWFDEASIEKPNDLSTQTANHIIDMIKKIGVNIGSAGPCADGGITITIGKKDSLGVIECFNTGEITIAFSRGVGRTTVREILPGELDTAIIDLCNQIKGVSES